MAGSVALAFDVLARDKASKTFDKIGKNAEQTKGRFDKLGKATVAVGAVAGVALVKFGKDSVSAFSEAEEAQKRLGFAFEKFPLLADSSQGALQKLNSELQKKTKYDDDAIASGQAVVAQFDVTGKQLEAVTPLLLDYASTTGKDLPSAGQDLGKALLGNAKALKNIGIKYTATGDRATDFANVTALMREKVGGFANKEATTAAGKAAILGNQFGELQETVGSKLLPVLVKLTDAGLKVVAFIDRNQKVLVPLVAVMGGLVGVVWAVNAAARAYTATQAALNIVMALNPIGLVVIGIAALAAGFVLAWKKSETFRNVVKGVFNTLKSIFLNFTGPGLLIKHWDSIIGTIKGLPARITRAAAGMWDGLVGGLKGAINAIIGLWNKIDFKVSVHLPDWAGGKGWTSPDIFPDIPKLASGGIVPATPGGRLALLGEGGRDEAVIPLSRRGGGMMGGDTYHVNVTVPAGFVGSELQLAEHITRLLRMKKRTQGTNLGLA